jgi:hypothetical protein
MLQENRALENKVQQYERDERDTNSFMKKKQEMEEQIQNLEQKLKDEEGKRNKEVNEKERDKI